MSTIKKSILSILTLLLYTQAAVSQFSDPEFIESERNEISSAADCFSYFDLVKEEISYFESEVRKLEKFLGKQQTIIQDGTGYKNIDDTEIYFLTNHIPFVWLLVNEDNTTPTPLNPYPNKNPVGKLLNNEIHRILKKWQNVLPAVRKFEENYKKASDKQKRKGAYARALLDQWFSNVVSEMKSVLRKHDIENRIKLQGELHEKKEYVRSYKESLEKSKRKL